MNSLSKDMVKKMLGFKTNEAVNKLVREGKLRLADKVKGQRIQEITYESLKEYVKNNKRYIDKNPMLAVSLGFIELGIDEKFSLNTQLTFNNFELKRFMLALKQIEIDKQVENPEEVLYLLQCRQHELSKQISLLAEINNEISTQYRRIEKQKCALQIEQIKAIIHEVSNEDENSENKVDIEKLIKIIEPMSSAERFICEKWLMEHYQMIYINYEYQRIEEEERRLKNENK